ncbi:MAG: hypothetical protein U9Q69_02055 [Nanoarchaeota archaeon]|nr:hypothetical protein [Nanoarchaeota archaeon]
MENKLKYCIEDPIEMDYKSNALVYGNKCSGCRSCGGGCYGCRVSEEGLEKKIEYRE